MPLEEFNETCTNGIRTENLCNHESIYKGPQHTHRTMHTPAPHESILQGTTHRQPKVVGLTWWPSNDNTRSRRYHRTGRSNQWRSLPRRTPLSRGTSAALPNCSSSARTHRAHLEKNGSRRPTHTWDEKSMSTIARVDTIKRFVIMQVSPVALNEFLAILYILE